MLHCQAPVVVVEETIGVVVVVRMQPSGWKDGSAPWPSKFTVATKVPETVKVATRNVPPTGRVEPLPFDVAWFWRIAPMGVTPACAAGMNNTKASSVAPAHAAALFIRPSRQSDDQIIGGRRRRGGGEVDREPRRRLARDP